MNKFLKGVGEFFNYQKNTGKILPDLRKIVLKLKKCVSSFNPLLKLERCERLEIEKKVCVISLVLIAYLNSGAAAFSEYYGLFVILGVFYFLISFFSVSIGLVIVAVSMLFSPEFQIGALGNRNIVLRIEDILIPVLLMAWLAQAAIQRKESFVVISPINRPVILMLLVSVISTLIGVASGSTKLLTAFFYLAKVIEFLLLYYLVLNFVRTERQVRIFIFFALLTVAFLAVFTLIQVPTTEMFTTRRISTPFEDRPQPATAGGYLAFSFFLTLSMMLYQKTPVRRILLGLLSVMVLIPLIYTFSRTAYVALAGGLVGLIFLSKIKWAKLAIVFVLLLSPIILPAAVKDRIAYTWEDAKNPGRDLGVDYSFQERIYSFRRIEYVLKRSPLIGFGIASWEYPDNQYVRTFYEIGMVGLVLWLVIYGRLFRMSKWH